MVFVYTLLRMKVYTFKWYPNILVYTSIHVLNIFASPKKKLLDVGLVECDFVHVLDASEFLDEHNIERHCIIDHFVSVESWSLFF